MIVFNGKVIQGTRACKTRSKSYEAFSSINYPYLAVLQDGRLLQYIENAYRDEPLFFDTLDEKVGLLKLIPGTPPALAGYMSLSGSVPRRRSIVSLRPLRSVSSRMRLIDAFRSIGLYVGSVVITQYHGQHGAEELRLEIGVLRLQRRDQLLDLLPLRVLVRRAGVVHDRQALLLGKARNGLFADVEHRPDLRDARARQIRHRLKAADPALVKQAHQKCLDRIVVVMAERDLVAAMTFKIARIYDNLSIY